MDAELTPPHGQCTRCGTTTKNISRINSRCHRTIDKKRCSGVFRSALSVTAWEACPTRAKTGFVGRVRCDQCGGDGWIYARRNF